MVSPAKGLIRRLRHRFAAVAAATIPVGHHPMAIAANPSGATAYLSDAADSTISEIDTETQTVVGAPVTVASGSASYSSSTFTLGSHSFFAVFVPSGPPYLSSSSPSVPYEVNQNVTVTSTPKTTGYDQSLTVIAFTNAAGTGASVSADKSKAAPSASLTTG